MNMISQATQADVLKAKPRKVKARSNVQMVRDLMEFSKYGPMAQFWVMDVLTREAKRQAEAGVPSWPADSFVNAEAWHGTACEINRKLSDAGYK